MDMGVLIMGIVLVIVLVLISIGRIIILRDRRRR